MNFSIERYKKYLNLKDAVFTPIEHEDALVAVVFKVLKSNGSQAILKICTRPQDYHCEVYFLKYFADLLPVPRILALVSPNDVPGAILMECLSGSLLKAADITPQLAGEMGAYLAKIHLHQTSGYGDLTQPQQLRSDSDAYFTFKFKEGLSECKNHLSVDVLKQCSDYYHANQYLLREVDGPCITHRDFRAGNLMIHEDKLQGIIDWSSARSSFAEEDLCPLLEEWQGGEGTRKSFLAGYGSIRSIPNYHPVMSVLRLSKAIASIGFTVKNKTWNNKSAPFYQYHLRCLSEFFKVKPR